MTTGSTGQFVKAQIVPLDGGGSKQQAIECMFNPREYTISRKVDWGNQGNDTSDTGNKVYRGGSPATLSLELFFDTYARRMSAGLVEDVRRYTRPLWELTQIDDSTTEPGANPAVKKGRPRKVLFQWGATWHFEAVITSMEQQFTLFMPDGTPVRSVIKVSFEQADKAASFHGDGGGAGTYNVSQNIRATATQRGFVGDLRMTGFGTGSRPPGSRR
jgi:Contractile injection system tube protein